MNIAIPRHFPRLAAAPIFALALACLCGPAFAATGHPLPLWQVSDAHGHTMYLAGSMHALKADDYPLPAPFATAFEHSSRLVEELDINALSPQHIADAVKSFGLLPAGETLAGIMGEDWPQAQKLAGKAGVKLADYRPFKPWLAAVRITGLNFIGEGYIPSLGLDRHFANLAVRRRMPVTGLETLDEQMGFFNDIKPPLQRRFLLQTLEETPHNEQELTALHGAWRDGDIAALAALAAEDFAAYPDLRAEVLDARNRRWLPVLESCMREDQGCFVVVGAEHMIGPAGLLALLEKAGYHVLQLRTATTPTPATAASTGA